MQTVTDLGPRLGVRPLCNALSFSSATYYRHRCASNTNANTNANTNTGTSVKRFVPRALAPEERRNVLDILHEPRFVDLAPAEVYATLLDEGTHLCSERTRKRSAAREAREAHHGVRKRTGQRAGARRRATRRGRPRHQGLGLYIVERIVAAHGGTVSVISSAEEGTTFTICIPRRE